MVAGTPEGPLWKKLGGRPGVLAAVVAATVLALTMLPRGGKDRIVRDPAADAQAAYLSLLSQIDPAGGDPAPTDSPAKTTVFASGERTRLTRDLFAPVMARKAPVRTATAVRPKSTVKKLPELSAVFIGGEKPLAVIDGRAVGEGDDVNGYRVVRIVPDGVIVEREGTLHALRPGGKS